MNNKATRAIIPTSSSIKHAMQCIQKTGFGIALVVDKNQTLAGVITDGDMRKALLQKKKLSTPVSTVMTTHPIVASPTTGKNQLLRIMLKKGICQIPIVDSKQTPVDLTLLRELQNIPLSHADITDPEVKSIQQVLYSPYLSLGPMVQKFEKKIATFVGTRYAVAVNSGTSGLHLAIRALDIKDDDEVITTPFSFIASANCTLFERAKPVFVDIDPNTLCIDQSKIEAKITKKTKAILPVHIFGHSAEMDALKKIASSYNLPIIEDACEALGTEYKGKKVGTFGDVAVFGFYPNKQITTAEGGIIVTNNKKLATLCQMMRNQGRLPGRAWLSHEILGYNYRMSELNAALGAVQMDRISTILQKREQVAHWYAKQLSSFSAIEVPYIASTISRMSWFVYVIRLKEKYFTKKDRDYIIETLKKHGIDSRNYFPPIHLEPLYIKKFGYRKGDYPVTESVASRTLALPFYNHLTQQEVFYICKTLKKILTAIHA